MKKFFFFVVVIAMITGLFLVANKHIPYFSARFFEVPSKYWLHRVNSPQRFNEAVQYFSGVELDIIYHENERKFENSHDPESLSKYDLENTLKMYSNAKKNIGIWFDFKNLTHENAEYAMATLDSLLEKYNIPKHYCIVESGNWKDLAVFKNGGYKTSYYVTIDKYGNDITSERKKILEISLSGNVNYISFGYQLYDVVSKIDFPHHIKLLVWSSGARWLTFQLNPFSKDIRNDERVQVILVGEKSQYYH